MGLQMDPNNRWIKMADRIPWDVFKEKYAKLFPSSTGNVENPYYKYFIGLLGYQKEPPIEASPLKIVVLLELLIFFELNYFFFGLKYIP